LNSQQTNSEKNSKWNYKRQTDDSWQQTGDKRTFIQNLIHNYRSNLKVQSCISITQYYVKLHGS